MDSKKHQYNFDNEDEPIMMCIDDPPVYHRATKKNCTSFYRVQREDGTYEYVRITSLFLDDGEHEYDNWDPTSEYVR